MKKSTLLSLVTAVAIVATSAGTYAAWDQLDATTTGKTVTLRNPASVSVGTDLADFSEINTFEAVPTYSSTATFTLKDMPADATGYKFVPTLKVMDGANDVTDKVDATATTSNESDLTTDKTVDVTIKGKDSTEGKALVGKTLTVTVKGEVKKVEAE